MQEEKISAGNIFAFAILLMIVLIFTACFILPEYGAARKHPREVSCISNLKQIGLALHQYAIDNDGKFPHLDGDAGLDMLRSNDYLTDYRIYVCPSTEDTGQGREDKVVSSYIYRGGLTEHDSPDSALAWDKPDNHENYGNILFLDGHVQGFAGTNWERNAK